MLTERLDAENLPKFAVHAVLMCLIFVIFSVTGLSRLVKAALGATRLLSVRFRSLFLTLVSLFLFLQILTALFLLLSFV